MRKSASDFGHARSPRKERVATPSGTRKEDMRNPTDTGIVSGPVFVVVRLRYGVLVFQRKITPPSVESCPRVLRG